MNLSVVVVSAGSAPELHECLDRLLSQEQHGDHEYIVVDDSGMQRLGPSVQQRYGDTVSVVMQGKNRGASSARNRGAQRASRTHLLFLDSDCFVSGDFFVRLHAAQPLLTDEALGGLSFKITGGKKVFSQGIRTDSLFRAHNLTRLPDAVQEIECVNTCCCLLRKRLFLHRGFREDFHYIFEDVEFSLYARARGYRFFYYPFCTAFHRGASFKASYARKTFFSYRNRLLTVLTYAKNPFLFFAKSFPYELMRTVKLFLLNPFLLMRALREVRDFALQRRTVA